MPPAIQIESLHKTFGSLAVLNGVDFAVDSGEVSALVGPNGAGKSTLLRILVTLVLPDSGLVVVAGHDVAIAPARARGSIGFVSGDERSWYWRLSARDNLMFFGRLAGLPKSTIVQRTNETLEAAELLAFADIRVGEFSSGMKGRLAVCRALLHRPPVLILDEPTRALDPSAKLLFRQTMRDLASSAQLAVLVATHDLHEAVSLGDRVALMRGGKVRRLSEAQASNAATLEQFFVDAPQEGLG